MGLADRSGRRERYKITPGGVALHTLDCPAVEQRQDPTRMTRREARAWLSLGDRRFLCRRCLPSDPRIRALPGSGAPQ
jgi:hypothetical protein